MSANETKEDKPTGNGRVSPLVVKTEKIHSPHGKAIPMSKYMQKKYRENVYLAEWTVPPVDLSLPTVVVFSPSEKNPPILMAYDPSTREKTQIKLRKMDDEERNTFLY